MAVEDFIFTFNNNIVVASAIAGNILLSLIRLFQLVLQLKMWRSIIYVYFPEHLHLKSLN